MSQSTAERPGLARVFIILSFNLVIIGVLILVLRSRVSLSCVRPEVSAASVAFLSLLGFHVFWRYLGPVIGEHKEDVTFGIVKVPIGVLVAVVDALHPWNFTWKLRERERLLLIALAAVVAGVAVYYGLTPYSPAQESEPTPFIQSFSVQEGGGEPELYGPNQAVHEILFGGQALVAANIQGPADVECKWSSAASGVLLPFEGCSTLYSPPVGVTRDSLTVEVRPACGPQQATGGLFINVVNR